MDVFDTLFFSVVSVGNDTNGQRIVDVEVIPTGLYLVEVPQVTILAVGRIHVFGRFFGLAHMLLTFVEDVADDVPPADDLSKLTVEKLKEMLDVAGVEYPADAKKADLLALLEAVNA